MESRRTIRQLVAFLGALLMAFYLAFPTLSKAQASLTTGAITGLVTDPSGDAIPNATVTATNVDTAATRTVATEANGAYLIPLLAPGEYMVRVQAPGFKTQQRGPVTVVVSQSLDLNLQLALGSITQVVQVTAAAPLLQPTNPNTTSTLGRRQIENIPNPGMDLSYEANFAPGAVMNTTGSPGNVEYNGLPAFSNNFTIDGLDANDPFFNHNNSGATNLQLGLSAMREVSVNTTSYSVDQGRLGASQINFLTKSGSNEFRGNLWEAWNGSKLNATDFFINSHQFESPAPHKPRSNVNQFGGSIGGPIIHDKLFFFGDFEEIRIILPIVASTLTPSSFYKSYQPTVLATGGCDYVNDPGDCAAGITPATDLFPNFPAVGPQTAQIPFFQNMFNLYGSRPGTPEAIFGCPIAADGSLLSVPSSATPNADIPSGVGCGIRSVFALSNLTNDQYILAKVSQTVNDRNTVWYDFTREHGLQATYTDPINPLFNVVSDDPAYNGEADWTHTFGPSLVNEFTAGVIWYSAIFNPVNPQKTLSALPIVWANFGGFDTLGGLDYLLPTGRNVTQWQLIDNLTWTHGNHDFRFGENLRRLLVSDHDFGLFNTPAEISFGIGEANIGVTGFTDHSFPRSLDEPFALVNFDVYAGDTYRARSKLTLTYGVRATWNSDPVNQQNLVARFPGNWYQISHDPNRPINQDIQTGLSKVFPSTPSIVWQPRLAVAYQFAENTVFRGGFGVFSDLFPASLADSMATNPPYDNTFNEGIFGLDNSAAITPGAPGSAIDAAVADNQAFLTGFSNGELSCGAPALAPEGVPCLPAVGIAAVEHYVKYPYFLQWSGGIQHQFSTNLALNVQYVWTHAVHVPYTIAPNGFQTVCEGCFSPWPAGPPAPDQRFFAATQYLSGANSIYHGFQATVNKRFSHGLNFQFNYTWSHCLDTISNGGIFGFGNPGNLISAIPGDLRRSYGPCDYDYRHLFNGYYTYTFPFHSASRELNQVVSGWEVSGSVIYHSGQPFSLGANIPGSALVNTSGPAYANLISGQPLYTKTQIGSDCVNNPGNCVTQPGNLQWLNPNAFLAVVDPDTLLCVPANSDVNAAVAGEGISPSLCQFGNMQRNFVRGPGFGWSDLFLSKRIKLTERATLLISGQAYNFLNHPNFKAPSPPGNPSGMQNAGIPGHVDTLIGFGNITATAQPPTGLLGSFLGGDTSPRMIALKGEIQF